MTSRDDREKLVRDAIKDELTDRGWSAAFLARRAGIKDSSTVRDFLNGERWPTLATQGRIEKALSWHLSAIREVVDEGAEVPPLGGDVSAEERVAELAANGGVTAEELQRLLSAIAKGRTSQQRVILDVWRAISGDQ